MRLPVGLERALETTRLISGIDKLNIRLEVPKELARTLSLLDLNPEIRRIVESAQQPLISAELRASLHAVSHEISLQFRLPAIAELSSMSNHLKGISAALQGFLPDFRAIEAAMKVMTTPWVDSLNAKRSYQGFAEIAALGNLSKVQFGDLNAREALKSAFGEWTVMPPRVLPDSLARDRFYLDHGFDPKPTTIPDPAFIQSLYAGKVLPDHVLPDAEEATEDFGSVEETEIADRLARAQRLIYRFESRLRNYLDQVMTNHCGRGWERHRLPENGKMHERWESKRQKDAEHRSVTEPLISYADFTDYEKLTTRADNWKEIFAAVFRDEQDLRVSFRRLHPIRLNVAHSRPITKGEFLTLSFETKRILVLIGVLSPD